MKRGHLALTGHPAYFVEMQSFRVKAGVHCEIAYVNERRNWRSYVTIKENTFDGPLSRTHNFVVFRSGRWFLRGKVADVMMYSGIR